ncbi:uncharacterized protein LOC123477105 [Daphnia magna]|uniref:uncharacterized protein LOC123477105 n=1 Tax=Daphnia magna TaxID=35525 RepID=UPI001E1BC22D|nr:uncharacterized protein LOC123477105 [Daphnia magna]
MGPEIKWLENYCLRSDRKVTTGTYHHLLPDSRVQIVTYKADGYGNTADVKYEAKPSIPLPPTPHWLTPHLHSLAVLSPAFISPQVTAPAFTSRTYSAPVFTSPVTVPGHPAQPSTVPATGSIYMTSGNAACDH